MWHGNEVPACAIDDGIDMEMGTRQPTHLPRDMHITGKANITVSTSEQSVNSAHAHGSVPRQRFVDSIHAMHFENTYVAYVVGGSGTRACSSAAILSRLK